MAAAKKSSGEKSLMIGFSKQTLTKDVEALEILTPQPYLLYVHDQNHKLGKRVIKEILQNKEISCFIVRFARNSLDCQLQASWNPLHEQGAEDHFRKCVRPKRSSVLRGI